jgi:ubiquinol-cytochrome c reductase cytochrome b subunit
VFALAFVLLGAIGAGVFAAWIPHLFGVDADVTAIEALFGRAAVAGYFGFFAFLWVYTRFGLEHTRPVPARVTSR